MNHRLDFFDGKAQSWEKNNPVSPAELERVLKHCRLEPGQVVLDVGTGTGRLVPLLLAYTGPQGRVCGIDPSIGMLEVARRTHQAPNLEFRRAAAEILPYADDSFQRAVCYAVFPHFADREAALSELARVLCPGGLLVIAHTKGRHAINRLHFEAGDAVRDDRLPPATKVGAMLHNASLVTQELIDEEDFYLVSASKQE